MKKLTTIICVFSLLALFSLAGTSHALNDNEENQLLEDFQDFKVDVEENYVRRENFEKLKEEHEELEEKHEKLAENYRRLDDRLSEAEDNLEGLPSSISDARNGLARMENSLEENVAWLQSWAESQEKKFGKLENEVGDRMLSIKNSMENEYVKENLFKNTETNFGTRIKDLEEAEEEEMGQLMVMGLGGFVGLVLSTIIFGGLLISGKLSKTNPLNARTPKQKIKSAKWLVDDYLEDDQIPEEEVSAAVSRYNKLIDKYSNAAEELGAGKMDYKL